MSTESCAQWWRRSPNASISRTQSSSTLTVLFVSCSRQLHLTVAPALERKRPDLGQTPWCLLNLRKSIFLKVDNNCFTVVAGPSRVRVQFLTRYKTNAGGHDDLGGTTTLGVVPVVVFSAILLPKLAISRRNTPWPMWLKRPSLIIAVTMLTCQGHFKPNSECGEL